VTGELDLGDEARSAWQELEPLLDDASPVAFHRTLYAGFFASRLGGDDALRRLGALSPSDHPWHRAMVALVEGDFDRAADQFAALGFVDEGYARLRAGEAHLAEGRRGDAEAQLRKAIDLYRPLGAVRYVSRGELLLTGAGLEVSA
jgi:hypothetical protein